MFVWMSVTIVFMSSTVTSIPAKSSYSPVGLPSASLGTPTTALIASSNVSPSTASSPNKSAFMSDTTSVRKFARSVLVATNLKIPVPSSALPIASLRAESNSSSVTRSAISAFVSISVFTLSIAVCKFAVSIAVGSAAISANSPVGSPFGPFSSPTACFIA